MNKIEKNTQKIQNPKNTQKIQNPKNTQKIQNPKNFFYSIYMEQAQNPLQYQRVWYNREYNQWFREYADMNIDFPNLQRLSLLSSTIGLPAIDILPESIDRLVNLQEIDITTPITHLPESIGNLTNLQRLYLTSTNITELPDSIVRLVNLKRLTLGHTRNIRPFYSTMRIHCF
jgi:Leucine-rich repeat (LRR) protein